MGMPQDMTKTAQRKLASSALMMSVALLLGTASSEADEFERIAPQELPSPPGKGSVTGAEDLAPLADEQGKQILNTLRGLRLVTRTSDILSDTNEEGLSLGAVSPDVQDALKQALNPFLGSALHENDLNRMSHAIVTAYRDEGLPFVDVAFPPQDVTAGIVQVVVTEFTLGRVEVGGEEWFAEDIYRAGVGLKSGEPLAADRLRRGINQLNANPFRRVNAVLKPGARTGETDLLLDTTDRFPLRVYGSFDNTGTPITDRERWSAGFNWGNAFWLGHQLSYQLTTSGDILHNRDRGAGVSDDPRFVAHAATYTVPLPWLDTLQIFGSHVKQVPNLGPFFGQVGESYQLSARYKHPLPSLTWASHEIGFGFDHKSSNNNLSFGGVQIFGNTTNVDQFLLTYEASAVDEYGQTTLANKFHWSPGKFNSQNTDASFAASGAAGASASYVYDTLDLTRVTKLPEEVSWVFRVKGQWANGNLISSEQLGGGGIDSVRGYEERALSRATGVLVSNELRAPSFPVLGQITDGMSDQLQLVAFYDFAYLRDRDRQPNVRQSATLQGVGGGARYALDQYVSLRFDYGWQMQELPGASEKGQFGAVSVTVSY